MVSLGLVMGFKEKILGIFGLGGAGSLPKKLHKGRAPLREGLKVPPWAQQDYYAKKEMGEMAPPEELAEEFPIKGGSADFLREKLDGGARVQQFEKTKKIDPVGQRSLGMKDGEIENYLGGVLQKDPKKK
jgi:hypothetical protein